MIRRSLLHRRPQYRPQRTTTVTSSVLLKRSIQGASLIPDRLNASYSSPPPSPLHVDTVGQRRKQKEPFAATTPRETLQRAPEMPQTQFDLPRSFQRAYTAQRSNVFNKHLDKMPLEAEREVQKRSEETKDWKPVVKVIDDRRLRVALIGTMNAGKSTLWNKLIYQDSNVSKTQQLTKDFDGITRDAVEAVGHLDGMFFTIIDTPGAMKGKLFAETVRTLDSVDLVLFIASADKDVEEDEKVLARYLRQKNIPCVACVNKIDLAQTEEDSDVILKEYEQHLQLGTPVGISALHAEGLDSLTVALRPFVDINVEHRIRSDWRLEDAAAKGDEAAMQEVQERNAAERYIRVAIIGRSCGGKSSLINRLVGFDRNKVHEKAFSTRDAVEIPCLYRGKRIKLIDTAGLVRTSYRRKQDFLNELHNATMKAIKFAHVCVICFDATEGYPNGYDMQIAHTCAAEGRAILFCANKWDAVPDPAATAEAIDFRIKKQMQEVRYVNAVVTSAKDGTNLTLLMDQITQLYDTWNKSVRSSELTRFWRQLERSVVIPAHVSRVSRVKQVNVRPPTFVLHLQTRDVMEEMKPLHVAMVKNALVEEFGFRGVPIRIIQEIRDTHPDYI